jgi:hypothetical protein
VLQEEAEHLKAKRDLHVGLNDERRL